MRNPLLQGPSISLASLLIAMTSVTHWPRFFNISWPVEPAPCPSPLCLSAAPLGASLSLNYSEGLPPAFSQLALTPSVPLLTCVPHPLLVTPSASYTFSPLL